MNIKRGNTVLADVYLKDNSYVVEEVMGEYTLTLNFLSRKVLDIQINDYVEFEGGFYKIRHNEKVTKRETSLGWEYNVTFYSSRYSLQDVEFFLHGKPERKKNFDAYTGTARQVLELIVKNMNRVETGWTSGSCIESRAETFTFKDKKVGSVLDEVVKSFETEYWISGKTISIGKRQYDSNGLVLGQGPGMGFTELEVSAVDDAPPVTVLYPYGSDKNLSTDYGSDYLLLPGGKSQIEKNVDKYGRIEKSMPFDHIFPKGEFTVTEKIDNLTLKAASIDFDITAHTIKDQEVIVTFQDGGLAGYDLAIVDKSWDNATKQFKLKVNEQENALTVPGDINFSVGDKFILTNLKMPQSYIDKASTQLQEESSKWLDEHCEKRIQLRGKCDDVLFRQQSLFISCGQMVGIVSEELKIDREIRVTRVKRYIENDNEPTYRYELTLSDFLQSNGFKDMVDDVNKVPEEIEDKVKPVREHTKRSWHDVMETMKMMFDPEGDYFTELIKPLAVHTAQLIVGTNSQQMDLVGVKFIPNADNDPNYFKSTAGKLVHFTVRETVAEWTIPASAHRLNNSFTYYIYAKCSKTTNSGSILATERKIKLEEEAGYYHFWVGVLNTPEENVRSWLPNYGYTEIAGQTITTGIIKDKLGRMIIDVTNGKFIGPATFTAGSSGYNNISDRPNLQPIYDGVNDALTNAENASNAANNAAGTANSKARVFYSTYTPSGANTNDLWVDGTNIYRYNGYSWVKASTYDNTETRIAGGLVTTGAVAVGPNGNPTGGICGSGSMRIWSGGGCNAAGVPINPTFSVDKDGAVYAGKSVVCLDSNREEAAGICSYGANWGNSSDPGSLRIWAGASYGNRDNAPFRVTMSGMVYTPKVTFGANSYMYDGGLFLGADGQVVLRASNKTREVMAITTPTSYYNTFSIKDTFDSAGGSATPAAMSINIGRSAYSDAPRTWLNCGHALGWGSKFIVESRYLGDANQMERTCVNVGQMASATQLESAGLATKGSWKPLYWNTESGVISWY